MAMILVTNLTNKDITVWYGHTPYHIGRNSELNVPLDAYILAIKHNDYKGKILKSSEVEVDEETGKVILPKDKVPEPTPEVKSQPWDNDDWDIMSASREELNSYASSHDLMLASDISDDDAQQIVIEHRIST